MYDDRVYELLLVNSGYGVNINKPMFFDKQEGFPVPDGATANRYGKRVDIKLTGSDLVFVADECGINTNVSKDNISNDKREHTKKDAV